MTARQSTLQSEGYVETSDEEGNWSLYVSSSNDPRPSLRSSVREAAAPLQSLEKCFYPNFQLFLRLTSPN